MASPAIGAPQTLPADFFDKQKPPATLPANFDFGGNKGEVLPPGPVPGKSADFIKPSSGGAGQWLSDAESDLRSGGSRTFIGRGLGHLQGRGDKGYEGLESGTTPAVADTMGSLPLGAIKTAQGANEYWHGHPLSGAAKALGGEAQMLTLPSMVMGGPAAEASIDAIPSRAYAGKVLQSVMGDAANVPVNLKNASEPLMRAYELGQRGATLPKPIRQLAERATDPEMGPLTYREARDFSSNLSSFSRKDLRRMNGPMRGQLKQLGPAFHQDIGDAAQTVGRGDDYSSGIKEYAQASKMHDLGIKAAKLAGGAALGGGLAGYAYKHLLPGH